MPTEDGHPTGLFSECPAPRQGLGAMGAQGVKAGIETPCPLLLAHLVQAGALAPHPTHPHSRPARHRGGLSHPRGQRSSDGWSQLPRARQQMGSTATLTHRPFGSKARLPISKPEPPADPLLAGGGSREEGTGREWNREVGRLKSTWPRTQNSDKTPKTPKRPETSTPEHSGEGGILPPPWGLSPAPSSRGAGAKLAVDQRMD